MDLSHSFGALHTGRPGGTVSPLRETPTSFQSVRSGWGKEMVPEGGAGMFLLNQRQSRGKENRDPEQMGDCWRP